jgi:hypothetical protein
MIAAPGRIQADNEANIWSVKDYYASIPPYSQPGAYINFAAEDDQGRVRDNFGANDNTPGRGQAQVRPGQPVPF